MKNTETMPNAPTERPSFILRVVANEATKRGLSAAVAGILVACVSEALFASTSAQT